MALKTFNKNDIFRSRLKTYPKVEFLITDRKIYFNKKGAVPGVNVNNVGHIDTGYISLYEINVDRPTGNLIYPYVCKDSTLNAFKTISLSDFSNYSYGDILSSTYPLDATISIDRFDANSSRPMINALEHTLDYYKCLSPAYDYDDVCEKDTQKLALVSVPSIFYANSIKKGSVDLKFYISGTMIGRLQDIRRNGELIQTEPYGYNGTGSIAGVCLYNEGFIILTGAWYLTNENTDYYNGGGAAVDYPKWYYFGSTGSSEANGNIPSSSFTIDFQGVNYINTLMMMCHADKGQCDQSNNPTWKEYGQETTPITSSHTFQEPKNIRIKNITKSPFVGASGSFSKVVYFNKIIIFDSERRPIAVAKMSKAIRKREEDSITVKCKIDLT